MRQSQLFGQTLRDVGRDVKLTSHKLLLRAGFIDQLGSGLFTLMPLGLRVFVKIVKIIDEELRRIGAQEILTPVVHPEEFWEVSGRAKQIGPELGRFRGPLGERYILAMTAEEVFTSLVKKHFRVEMLPLILNQFQTKYRGELRPRGGLLRLREFVMQDAYSFDADERSAAKTYQAIFDAYERIFKRLELPALPVEASVGLMGGEASHEFVILSQAGEDEVVVCEKKDYAANLDCARATPLPVRAPAKFEKRELLATPGMKSVEEVASYLGVQPSVIIKSLLFEVEGEPLLVMLRGDAKLSEAKLAALLLGRVAKPATLETFERLGTTPGSLSPIGLRGLRAFADVALKIGGPYLAGANKPDHHLSGVRPADLGEVVWADLAQVQEGERCPKCGAALSIEPSIELGHTFRLGIRYSEAFNLFLPNKKGKKQPVSMGSYGIGLERQMAAIVEVHHDGDGIVWPASVAPFPVHLISLYGTGETIKKKSDELYNKFRKENFELLYDDRDRTAGTKLVDADLIGIPLRIVLSRRSLQKNSCELQERKTKEPELVPLAAIIKVVREKIS